MADLRRVALVTGANRGIGRAIAQRLTEEDHLVGVAARTFCEAQAAAAEMGHGSVPVQLDVTDPASVQRAVETLTLTTGRLDVVVNNAGGHYDEGSRMSAVTDDELRDALEVNTIGPLRVCRAALAHMRGAGWGRIVNVSSRSGTFAATWADAPAYAVSKAALNMLTFQLAKELEGTGILVNACCPGWVRTRMGGDDAELTVEQGADTPVWLATLPNDGPTGGLFADREPIAW